MRVILCFKDFGSDSNVSHSALGITAGYTAKTLRAHGIYAEARPILGANDLTKFIHSHELTSRPVTHVIIMAQFIPLLRLRRLVFEFPHIHFVQKCHSNIGFLQAEPPAIDLLRGAIALEQEVPNFKAATNNKRLAEALFEMYGQVVTYLPNLYYVGKNCLKARPPWSGGLLKIGAFGSLRVYKNFSTAIAASIALTRTLKVHSEIWINSGRHDGAGNVVYRTAEAWTKGVPYVTLKQYPWSSWPEFKQFVGSMNILMQPSYTETFNNVTADGITQGVASVVGPSIEWVPDYWKAEPDDCPAVAAKARQLLLDPVAPEEGYESLKEYVAKGLIEWKKYLML